MSLKLMCCHGVCLAVKLPCCFSTPIQAKKNGEEIKTNAEQRHSISCCSVLSFASTPSTAWVSLQLTPRHRLGETASLVCVTLGKCVVGAWESPWHSFCMNSKAGGRRDLSGKLGAWVQDWRQQN